MHHTCNVQTESVAENIAPMAKEKVEKTIIAQIGKLKILVKQNNKIR